MEVDGEHNRLGRLARKRRQALGLSISEAARRAHIARNTWAGLEDATRKTAEHNWAGIERSLRWSAGSIEAILGGGEPEQLGAIEEPAGDHAAVRQIRLILDSELAANLTAETKLAMIKDVIAREAADDEAVAQPEPRRASG